jgi:hypothetical protein
VLGAMSFVSCQCLSVAETLGHSAELFVEKWERKERFGKTIIPSKGIDRF